jgi:hypothetical protein
MIEGTKKDESGQRRLLSFMSAAEFQDASRLE